jgi:hypothetical protein
MFGHDDKDKDEKDKTAVDAVAADDNQTDKDWQHPGSPLNDNSDESEDNQNDDKQVDKDDDTVVTPDNKDDALDTSPPETEDAAEVEESISKPSSPSTGSTDDLIDIKQDALGKLSPLVDHLDQAPEEKFRTLMMMIQASDDQSMIKEAYAAAQKITDEKERAQALLDVVNEINYFTQNPAKNN